MFDHVTLVGDGITTTGTTTLGGSILDAGAGGTVCDGAVTSAGSNLEHGTSCALAMSGDASGVDPLLGPLQDNGGGTLTHALTAASPAVDAAGACGLTEDQRGKTRPLDGNLDTVAACDVGAFELDPADTPTTSPTTSTTTTTTPGGGGDDVDDARRLLQRDDVRGGALPARRAPERSRRRRRAGQLQQCARDVDRQGR